MKNNIYLVVLVIAVFSFACQNQGSTKDEPSEEKVETDTSSTVDTDKSTDCPQFVIDYEEAVDRFIEISLVVNSTQDTSLFAELQEITVRLEVLEKEIKNSTAELHPDCVVLIQSAVGRFLSELKDYVN